jgi:SAM-dependent methyltransferase
MRPLTCAVCRSEQYRIRYPEQIPPVNMLNFSARRSPQKHHARIVECCNCGLIYSNPYFEEDLLRPLYREASYIDEQQLDNMSADYLREFTKALDRSDRSTRILEIGCADGFFLKRLLAAGFTHVYGVEPGKAAVAKASPDLRCRIVNDFFQPDLFPGVLFDVVCCFQIFDHMPDPNRFLSDIHKVLTPGGIVLAINHNIRALITRMLGEKSPMFDIEHIYLFDKHTIRKIFEANGFEVSRWANLSNSYRLAYAVKMFPFPAWIKNRMASALEMSFFSHWNLRVPAGNMVTIGRKRD